MTPSAITKSVWTPAQAPWSVPWLHSEGQHGGDRERRGDEAGEHPGWTGGSIRTAAEVVADGTPRGARKLHREDGDQRKPEREMDRAQRRERESTQVEEHQREEDDQPRVRCEDQVAHDLRGAPRVGSVLEDVHSLLEATAGSGGHLVVRPSRGGLHHQTLPVPPRRTFAPCGWQTVRRRWRAPRRPTPAACPWT